MARTTDVQMGHIANEDVKEKGSEVTPSANQVCMLQKQGDDLATVKDISNLGTSERAHSMRFANDRGYVLVFRAIDPSIKESFFLFMHAGS